MSNFIATKDGYSIGTNRKNNIAIAIYYVPTIIDNRDATTNIDDNNDIVGSKDHRLLCQLNNKYRKCQGSDNIYTTRFNETKHEILDALASFSDRSLRQGRLMAADWKTSLNTSSKAINYTRESFVG